MNVDRIDDDTADRILSGRAHSGSEADLAALFEVFVADGEAVVPVASEALARAFATGVLGDDESNNVVPLAAGALGIRRRRRIAVRTAVAVGMASIAFSGVAAAGGLPDPLQSAAASAAQVFGVSIPDPGTSEQDPSPTDEPKEPATVPETSVAPGLPPMDPVDPVGGDEPEIDGTDIDDDPAPTDDGTEFDGTEIDDDPAPTDDGTEFEVDDDDPAPTDDGTEIDDDPAPTDDGTEAVEGIDDDPVTTDDGLEAVEAVDETDDAALAGD